MKKRLMAILKNTRPSRSAAIATTVAFVLCLVSAPAPASAIQFPTTNFGTVPTVVGSGTNTANYTVWMKTVTDTANNYNLNDGALLEVQLGGATMVSGQECATSSTWLTGASSCASVGLAITLPGPTALATPANTKFRYFDNGGVATIQIELAWRAASSYPVGTKFEITLAPGVITFAPGTQPMSLMAKSIAGGYVNTANAINDSYQVYPVVSFDANGGNGTMANQLRGTTGPLTTNTFTRSGYTFAGWNTVANGTGGAAYADGASYNFLSSLALYAQWTANPVPTLTLAAPLVVLGPEIHSSNPRVIDQGVAKTLTIKGSRFEDLLAASIGGLELEIISANESEIKLAIPTSQKLGPVDLKLNFKKSHLLFQEVFTIVDPAVALAAAANRLPKPEVKIIKAKVNKAPVKKKKK